jgi:hypothetical protein
MYKKGCPGERSKKWPDIDNEKKDKKDRFRTPFTILKIWTIDKKATKLNQVK